ncbi:PAS-domain containing protein [Sphingosinicellaceae bacterium]|nr:PAS-domain containing protein [Sphingosinicellaceae bacterium]
MTTPHGEIEALRREVAKLRRINEALMDRVERSTDLQGGAYSVFQTAITLEERVRDRTRELGDAMRALSASNAGLSRANEEAGLAQQRFRDAIESINEGFALFDTDDRLVLCNSTYLGLWPTIADRIVPGLTFHEIAGLIAEEGITLGAMVTPDRWLSERISQHAIADGAHVHAFADGRWIQINELRTFEGGIVCVYTDITDVKVADARLRERELAAKSDLLQATLDAIPHGVAVYDADRRLTVWNRPFRLLLDLPAQVVANGATHDQLVAYNLRQGTAGMAEEALAWSGSGAAEEQPWRRSTLEVRRAAMPDGGLVLTFADVTERRQFVEALRDGEARLRLVADGMPAFIAYIDDRERYQFANRHYVERFGNGRTNIIGLGVRELLGEAAYAVRRPHVVRVLAGETTGFELGSDGGRVLSAAYIPHRDEDGSVRGWFTLIQDITEQRDAARALEHRVAERTAELSGANLALQGAKQIAEAANLSKTRFLAAASHDLLQPLNAARLFVTALAERRLASESRGLVDRIESALLSVEDLLESLLEISVLDAGAVQPQRTDFAIQPLLASLHAEFAPLALARGIELGMVRSNATINSDQRLLRRILQNFISNALRYTDGKRILVGCRREPGGVRVEVVDTGPGIAADKHALIFDEFARLDGEVRGIGLGLAIVERAGRMLGHRIMLRSAPGQGSTFGVSVPTSSVVFGLKPGEALPAVRRHPLDGVRLLVIDNEPAVRDGMAALLGGWSCIVATASDAASAVARIDEGFQPQVLIVDYHLDGGLLGCTEVATIRERLRREVPAMIVTADRSPETHAAILAAGLSVQTKPVKPAQLRALITRLAENA